MAKYINADELKKVFRDTEDAEYARWTLAGVIGEIDDIEAADVVSVVRCGECKNLMQDGRCFVFADDNIKPSASDFCSYGERKDG